MEKEKSVINYYLLCNKLKDVIRSGWKYFKVNRKRVESVAEHIYGVQMLAIAMKSEFKYDVDIMKVIYMLAIHELGETVIGDLLPISEEYKNKEKTEHEAVHKILSSLIDGEEIEKLFLEYDAHETKEAIFAYQCDKLEADIQCKLYDLEGCVDLSLLPDRQDLIQSGKSWSTLWLESHQKKYPYDENFMSVSNYIKDNKID